ncbi:unnamed protein product [Rhizophagus irregularis]|nr:unnamed protein product [Rhizophagus irregularis]
MRQLSLRIPDKEKGASFFLNVKSALDAFEVEKKSLKVTNFWTEIQNLEEEKKCSHWGTSAYSGKRLLNMQMDKFAK